MSGPNQTTIEKLFRLIGTPSAPVLIDVRIDEDFERDPRIIPASLRISHHDEGALAQFSNQQQVIVACEKGLKLSEGTSALLRHLGVNAMSLEGGVAAWREAGLPMVPWAIVPRHNNGKTRWVTRHRPKIDRIACPWLIKRFVDREAVFMFVTPDQVDGVADRFNATPFDMDSGFWTHEGQNCTFDKMLHEFGLTSEPLLRLADIVRCADTNRLADNPQAAGLLAISLGLSRQYSSDLEQLEAGLGIYDALYRWCRDATDEEHAWPAKRAKTTP